MTTAFISNSYRGLRGLTSLQQLKSFRPSYSRQSVLEHFSKHQHNAQLEDENLMTSMTQTLRLDREQPVALQIEDPDRASSRNLRSQRLF